MKVYNMIQNSDEWYNVRKGKLTASHATEIANNGKGLKTYINNIVLELIFGERYYTSKDMERGNEFEPIARFKYEFEKGVEVKEVGFIEHCPYSGYSPDGLINEDGLIEIKARNNAKHLSLLRGSEVDSSTIWQMQFGLMVTKRKWCDFISYNPNFKKNSLFVKRFFVDEEKQEKLKIGLESGINMLKKVLEEDVIKQELI